MDTREKRFWRIFSRTFGRDFESLDMSVEEINEWDSLKHIELMFELEQAFDIDIPPEEIANLYSSTGAIINFLNHPEMTSDE